MQDFILLAVGIAVGGLASWFIARHYYIRSGRERPAWADGFRDDVIAQFVEARNAEDPGDLVAIFEAALEDRLKVVDGGHF